MENTQEYNEKIAVGSGVLYNIGLNASEIGELWNTYMAFSMYAQVYKYFLNNIEDKDIRSVIEEALNLSNQRIDWVMNIFTKEGLTMPFGYSDEDININAPRLYSDSFYLHFLMNKARIGILIQGLALTSSTRSDVREFYYNCCLATTQLYQRTVDLLISKGLYINPPHITIHKNHDVVREKSFLAGYFVDKRRPLLAKEIANLFLGISSANFAKAVYISFRQSANSKRVRDYMNNSIDLMNKGLQMFTAALNQENIPVPMAWDTFVTDSTVPPFSDKLMMAKAIYMNEAAIMLCGEAIANNLRRDLLPGYTRIMTDAAKFAEDATNIMIENGWFEEPPRVINREELIKQ